MARKYIISFLGTSPSDRYYEYIYQNKSAKGRVFAEALKDLVEFDRMFVCITEGARDTTWKIVASLNDNRIEDINITDGMNESELWSNFNKITDKFNQGDEVIFDITHGLRSLPFLVFLFAAYLKVAKQVKIASVLYGVLEKRQTSNNSDIAGVIPVVELEAFVSMLDWMSATQRFVNLGDGNGLAQLLRTVAVLDLDLKFTVDQTADAIEQVSNALIYIRPMEVMKSVAQLNDLIPKLAATQGGDSPQLQPFLLLCDQIIDRYQNLALAQPFIKNNLQQNLQCQLQMMSWYQEHQQQVKSIMLGRELFVSILMYWQGEQNIFDYKSRKPAENNLNSQGNKGNTEFDRFTDSQKIKDTWKKATNLRNDFAHSGMSNNPESINNLKQNIDRVIEEIKTCLQDFLNAAIDRPRHRLAPPKLRSSSSNPQP